LYLIYIFRILLKHIEIMRLKLYDKAIKQKLSCMIKINTDQ